MVVFTFAESSGKAILAPVAPNPGGLDAPCWVYAQAFDKRVKVTERYPERVFPDDASGLAAVEAFKGGPASDFLAGALENEPDGQWMVAFHRDITLEQAEASFRADGFEVIRLREGDFEEDENSQAG